MTRAEIQFVLQSALELGIRIGAAPDGSELILVAPMKVPIEIRRQFERLLAEHQQEFIAEIQAECAARERLAASKTGG
jgi:hypothetical protein